jgi:hypothetical protein
VLGHLPEAMFPVETSRGGCSGPYIDGLGEHVVHDVLDHLGVHDRHRTAPDLEDSAISKLAPALRVERGPVEH